MGKIRVLTKEQIIESEDLSSGITQHEIVSIIVELKELRAYKAQRILKDEELRKKNKGSDITNFFTEVRGPIRPESFYMICTLGSLIKVANRVASESVHIRDVFGEKSSEHDDIVTKMNSAFDSCILLCNELIAHGYIITAKPVTYFYELDELNLERNYSLGGEYVE